MKYLLYIKIILLSVCLVTAKAEDKKTLRLMVVPEGKAIIYVYRPSQFVNSAGYPYTHIDGDKKNPLYNGSYKAYTVNPGKHTVETIGDFWIWGLPDNKVVISTENGKRYFVRLTSGSSGTTIIGSSVYMGKNQNFGGVPENIAISEISELNTPEQLEKQWAKDQKAEDAEWGF